jgi:hypothetical protein
MYMRFNTSRVMSNKFSVVFSRQFYVSPDTEVVLRVSTVGNQCYSRTLAQLAKVAIVLSWRRPKQVIYSSYIALYSSY